MLRRLLFIAFLESFAVVLVERGIYFYTKDVLAFSDGLNLWLALVFGSAYVTGALLSHPFTRRLAEKPALAGCLLAQAVFFCVLTCVAGALDRGLLRPDAATAIIFVAHAALGWLNGLKWPIIETYISAGQTQVGQLRVVGRFNVSWAAAVLPALAAAGMLIQFVPPGLFVSGAVINLVSLLLTRPLARRPLHMAADHPDRPTPRQTLRYGALLGANRWQMLSSYACMWIIAALIPGILVERLGVPVSAAAGLSGVLDGCRLLAFVLMGRWTGWHSRFAPVLVTLGVMPAGLFMVLFGRHLPMVLAGELLFGISAGMTYCMALYYVMVVKNASVDAGGSHEGLIGSGFTLGPLAGLAGRSLALSTGHKVLGMLGGVAPLLAVCTAGSLWAMWGYARKSRKQAVNESATCSACE